MLIEGMVIAAFAAGAPLHDIRQGLRTFTTSYYLSPGRMNQVQVGNVEVFIDYCHNAAGMRALGQFVDAYATQQEGRSDLKMSRIGMIGAAGDRRDEDMRELGEVAAHHFDVVVVREDDRLRGRRPGETADLVVEGVRRAMAAGARCRQVEVVLSEITAVGHVMARANPGDLVMMCVDQHADVLSELESRTSWAQAGSHSGELAGDPDLDPSELSQTATSEGTEAEEEALGASSQGAQGTPDGADGSEVGRDRHLDDEPLPSDGKRIRRSDEPDREPGIV